jgi:hypothetical protein
MRRILLTAAALVVMTVAANASIIGTYECGAAKSSPPDNDPDPVYKTKVETVAVGENFPLRGFYVEHHAASGKVYVRSEQYRDQRYWSTDKPRTWSDNWSGVSIKYPGLTMIGSIQADNNNRRVSYVEKLFRNGKLETTIVSLCRPADVEG